MLTPNWTGDLRARVCCGESVTWYWVRVTQVPGKSQGINQTTKKHYAMCKTSSKCTDFFFSIAIKVMRVIETIFFTSKRKVITVFCLKKVCLRNYSFQIQRSHKKYRRLLSRQVVFRFGFKSAVFDEIHVFFMKTADFVKKNVGFDKNCRIRQKPQTLTDWQIPSSNVFVFQTKDQQAYLLKQYHSSFITRWNFQIVTSKMWYVALNK